MNAEERLAHANKVLVTFRPGWRIYRKGDRLRVSDGYEGDCPAILGSCGEYLALYTRMSTGMTGATAVGQLIRWIRGWTRHSIRIWEYWASDTVILAKPETLRLLSASDYLDPNKTCCVLCGGHPRGGDWRGHDGRSGPCCAYECCVNGRRPGPDTYSWLPRRGKIHVTTGKVFSDEMAI